MKLYKKNCIKKIKKKFTKFPADGWLLAEAEFCKRALSRRFVGMGGASFLQKKIIKKNSIEKNLKKFKKI